MTVFGDDDRRWIVTTSQLAKLLDLSERGVRKAAQEGVLERCGRGRFDLRKVLPAYVRNLRGHLGVKPGDVPDLAEARARQAESAARLNELKAAELEGRLVRREVVEEIFGRVAAALRAGFSTLPSKARGRIPHLTPADAQELEMLIRDVLADVPKNAGLPEPVRLEGREEAEEAHAASDAGGN